MIICSEGILKDDLVVRYGDRFVEHFQISLIREMIPYILKRVAFIEEPEYSCSTRIRAELHTITKEEKYRILSFLVMIEGELPSNLEIERNVLINLVESL